MLLQVAIENVLSFRDEVVFSLLASPGVAHAEGQTAELTGGRSAVRVAALYGANAAGKSNLVKALAMARDLVVEGTRPGKPIRRQPFKLTRAQQALPSRMEFHWALEGHTWSFGFGVDDERVHEEWLAVGEEAVYERTGDALVLHDSPLISPERRAFFASIAEGVRPEQLFLTQAGELSAREMAPLYRWWSEGLQIVDPESARDLERIGLVGMGWVMRLVQQADTGVSHLSLRPSRGAGPIPDEADETELRVHHHGGEPGGDLSIDEESDGTRRLLGLAQPLQDVSSGKTRLLVIDELDSSLHTLLGQWFVRTFLALSERDSQLLFTTHDTQLLDTELVSRDGIWFVEKDRTGGSTLYSLAEFKEEQLDRIELERGYLQGRFGAIPFLGDPARLGWSEEEE